MMDVVSRINVQDSINGRIFFYDQEALKRLFDYLHPLEPQCESHEICVQKQGNTQVVPGGLSKIMHHEYGCGATEVRTATARAI
jgi:hypothetical protein